MPSTTPPGTWRRWTGSWCPVASGAGGRGKIQAITHAREKKVPFLGLCFGFQLAVIEYARGVLGFADAASEEFGSGTFVVALLPEQKGSASSADDAPRGLPGHALRRYPCRRLYGRTDIMERHRHGTR